MLIYFIFLHSNIFMFSKYLGTRTILEILKINVVFIVFIILWNLIVVFFYSQSDNVEK